MTDGPRRRGRDGAAATGPRNARADPIAALTLRSVRRELRKRWKPCSINAPGDGARAPSPRGEMLAWEGFTLLEVARQAGHSVAVCDRHYAGIFEDVDPAKRVTAEAAIRAAREPGVRGVCALFDSTADGGMP